MFVVLKQRFSKIVEILPFFFLQKKKTFLIVNWLFIQMAHISFKSVVRLILCIAFNRGSTKGKDYICSP